MENTSHFLFICQKFNAISRELLHTVSNNIKTSEAVLLFGIDSLSGKSNEVIFRAVINVYNKPKDFHEINRIFFYFNQKTDSNQQYMFIHFNFLPDFPKN